MRLFYLNAFLCLIILTSGCASNVKRPSFPILNKAWNSSRAVFAKVRQRPCLRKKLRGNVGVGHCGCDHCSARRLQEVSPVGYQQQQFFLPQEAAVTQSFGTDVIVEDCGCNQLQHVNAQPTPAIETVYGTPECTVLETEQGIAPTESPPAIQYYPPMEQTPETTLSPVVEPLDQEVNVEQGEFDIGPELLEAPKSQAIPYVEPNLNTAPPQIEGVGVPELDADTGFLSPQGLTDSESENELAEESIEELDDIDSGSVSGPTEAELAQKNILESVTDTDTDTGPVVLKARPVANHKLNNQNVLQRGDAIATYRTDTYGLPVDGRVQFSELPPLDAGTRPRPASFQREEVVAPPETAPPAKNIEEVDVKDKTTGLDNEGMQVVESTTDGPTDAEPMLRMTAVPYAGSSSLGAAIARIKVGKTPLIVRGGYPKDLEYERLARERSEQATGSVIIPSTSLKTIDR